MPHPPLIFPRSRRARRRRRRRRIFVAVALVVVLAAAWFGYNELISAPGPAEFSGP